MTSSSTCPGHLNVHTFVFGAIFLTFNISSNDRKQKSAIDKEQTPKNMVKKFSHFWVFFWVTKMGTLKTIRALMYWPNSVPVREKGRERQKKRDREAVRAHDCPKRHANYGLSSPVSNPTLGESLAQMWVAQWRI